MRPEKAIPLLRVADVGKSAAWYRDMLGFEIDAFPDGPPHVFAILRRDSVELMLRRSPFGRDPKWEDWDVRIPLIEGLRELHARLSSGGVVCRGLEQMPYCDTEFDVRDPDGYVICFSEMLPEVDDVPKRSG
jgi:catechol 2,3-dioxygenase-like lactoylglutathione lyase family enzyme